MLHELHRCMAQSGLLPRHFSPKVCFLWEDHRQYANATDVNSKTTLPKTNTSHLKMDAFLQTIQFLLRKAYLFRCEPARCQFQGGGIFLPSYIKPLKITSSDEVISTTKKNTLHRGLVAFSFSASALQKRMDSLLKLDEAGEISLPQDGWKSSPR